jgi:chorismate mutase/prephenate dehydratase
MDLLRILRSTVAATKSLYNEAMLKGEQLQALRDEIGNIDRDLMQLLKRRMDCVEKIAAAKVKAAYPFRDQEREEHVLRKIRRAAVEYGLDARQLESLYRQIMEMSISHQQAYVRGLTTVPLRVAYQGVEGSYSHLSAQLRYANREGGSLLSGYESVQAVADAVRHGEADVALLPIENSTAGSINDTYDILADGALTITAEVFSQVQHCLIALPGATVEDLRRVISHPQALWQCEEYLQTLPWVKPEAEFDTAGAARKVKELNDRTLGAIASESAAAILGLQVVKKSIQTQPENTTRFVEVAIEASPCPHDQPCKTSLLVVLHRKPGTLGQVLTHFGSRGISLTKLESRPIPSSPWEYRFYLDVEAHAKEVRMTEVLKDIQPLAREFVLLGTYPQADRSHADDISAKS